MSRARQVVVFTHDTRMGAWASKHLDPTRDALVTLDPPRAAGQR